MNQETSFWNLGDVKSLAVKVGPVQKLAEAGPWQTELLHSTEYHRIIFISRGQGQFNLGGQATSYGPNSLFFVPSGMPHSFDIRPCVFGTAMEIRPAAFLDMPTEALHLLVREVRDQARLVSLIELLQDEYLNGTDGSMRACLYHAGLLGVWMTRLARSNAPETPPKKNTSLRLVRKFLAHLEIHFASGANIADMCNALDVTPTHLTRCCQKTCGKSALALLNERLNFEARELLINTDLPINQVAQDLGFGSAAYFTRAFRQSCGQTPSVFRGAFAA